jgi:hypothetical protein
MKGVQPPKVEEPVSGVRSVPPCDAAERACTLTLGTASAR